MIADEHDTFREWLYLEADGELSAAESGRLRRHLESCGNCRSERASIDQLFRAIETSKVDSGSSLAAGVLSALPPAGWEARNPRSWAVAAVLLTILAASAAVLVSSGAPAPALPVMGALATIGDLFRATLVTGAGLLAASWTGLGMGLRQALGDSILNYVAIAVLVLGLDLLFLRFLARSVRRAGAAAARTRR